MKGNYMSLDCKWLVSSPREGGKKVRCGVVWSSSISTPKARQSLDVIIIKQILKIWGRKTEKRNGFHNSYPKEQWQTISISNVSARQVFPNKVALQVGGLEGCAVIKVKAWADESAECFCCTSDCLRGQRSTGNCMNMHGNKAAHPQFPQEPDDRRSRRHSDR